MDMLHGHGFHRESPEAISSHTEQTMCIAGPAEQTMSAEPKALSLHNGQGHCRSVVSVPTLPTALERSCVKPSMCSAGSAESATGAEPEALSPHDSRGDGRPVQAAGSRGSEH